MYAHIHSLKYFFKQILLCISSQTLAMGHAAAATAAAEETEVAASAAATAVQQ